jgi:hypothetical protein
MEEDMTDEQLLEAWYQYAAGAPGFIGGALRIQREKAFLSAEQQRALIGIQDEEYTALWLRLQAMPNPRPDQFATDLARIVAKVQSDGGTMPALDLARLGELIRAGLESKESV